MDKNGKFTTKKQFDNLLSLLKENPQLVKGKNSFGNKELFNEKWEKIADHLNNLGPPVRTGQEWQRVWVQYKANLKRKIAKNQRNFQESGGDPTTQIRLSPLEEKTIELMKLDKEVYSDEEDKESLKSGIDKIVWTRDETWKLIYLLDRYELLWNHNHQNYKNRMKKESAYAEITQEINTKSAMEVKKKINALRLQYIDELTKIKKIKASTSEKNVPKWEFFTALNSLFNDSLLTNPAVETVKINVSSQEYIEDQIESSESSENENEASSDQIMTVQRNTHTKNIQQQKITHIAPSSRNIITSNHYKDDYEIFGLYVAQELRQYDNDEILKIETKNAIQKCLLTASSKYLTKKYNSHALNVMKTNIDMLGNSMESP